MLQQRQEQFIPSSGMSPADYLSILSEAKKRHIDSITTVVNAMYDEMGKTMETPQEIKDHMGVDTRQLRLDIIRQALMLIK